MFKNYVLTIVRQVRKNKVFTLINVLGLAVGMSACIAIAQFVNFHLSFDDHHSKSESIYRVHQNTTKAEVDLGESGKTQGILAQVLIEESPHVENAGRFWSLNYMNNSVIYKGEEKIITWEEDQVYGCDQEIFDILDLPFIYGDASAFDIPNKAVMTKSTAAKYFGDLENAIGKQFALSGNNGSHDFELTGIIEDIPKNSHLDIGILVSIKSIDEFTNTRESWYAHDYFTYAIVPDESKIPEIELLIADLYQEHASEVMTNYGYEVDYFLRPITEIHTQFRGIDFDSGFKAGIDIKVVIGLGIIALIVLIIAWINYLNLSLVKTMERLKEIGIRKVMGSNTRQITILFMLESFFLNLFSFLVAMTLTQIISPFLVQLTGLEFSFLENINLILGLLLIVVAGSILIGLYPSLMLKTLNTNNILLGNRQPNKVGKISLRTILVSLQFVITFLLIAATLTVYKQINYMKSADLGFHIDDIMMVKAPPGDVSDQAQEQVEKFNVFKTEILKNSGISEVTNGGEVPGSQINWLANLHEESKTTSESINTYLFSMGREYLDFFDLEIVAGRNLMPGEGPWSSGEILVNERFVEMLGYEDPNEAINKKLKGFFTGNPLIITGIVKNHHQTSLHDDFVPIAYILSSWTEYYFIKLQIPETLPSSDQYDQLRELVTKVEDEWYSAFGDIPFEHSFLDQFFNQQYQADERFGKIFTTFATLAILIACLGLFGLTSFTLQQRTKEIGIRMVLGASFSQLVVLLSKNYLITILAAYFIAMPFAWMGMRKWLENYTFQIELGAWLLIIPLALVLLIAILTILSRMTQSLRMNPVDALRDE